MSLVRFANTFTVYYQVVQVYLTLASIGRYLVLGANMEVDLFKAPWVL